MRVGPGSAERGDLVQRFDVAIIGAGVAGACLARELARYQLDVVVLEAGIDVANGATRANSGIVHAGFDPHPGTRKARYNVAGSALFPQWASELGFPYVNNGSLVLAFSQDELEALEGLRERGHRNGVRGLRLIDAQELRELESNVSPEAVGALCAPTGAICDPYQLCWRAAENAADNGVKFWFDARVVEVRPAGQDGGQLTPELAGQDASPGYCIHLATAAADARFCGGQRELRATCVVNCAGTHAGEIHNMVSGVQLEITPRRGEYCLMDTDVGGLFGHTMFQAPTAMGKGVLITPTVHGNLLVGPNACPQQDPDDASTTAQGLAEIVAKARRTFPGLSTKPLITNFAGVRAGSRYQDLALEPGDFVIGQPADAPGFFDVAGFESPGLTSAPAVAQDLAAQIAGLLGAQPKADFNPRTAIPRMFSQLAPEEQAAAVEADPRAGRMLCRCNSVTQADIAALFSTRLPVLCMDAIKWRANAMMGRCHGGFCMPEISKTVAAWGGVAPDDFPKRWPQESLLAQAPDDYCQLAAESVAEDVQRRVQHDEASCPADEASCPAGEPRWDYDVVCIGGGAAGIAAATAAAKEGARVALVDRESNQGGILKQCIHNGFGLHRFGVELTGPEYASRELEALSAVASSTADQAVPAFTESGSKGASDAQAHTPFGGVAIIPQTSVMEIIPPDQHGILGVSCVGPRGVATLHAGAVVISTGSRERGAGALNTPGTRPAGVFSAGSAQNYMNLQGCLPGKKVAILGSGDIGLIMARRLTFAGAQVVGVFEINPEPSGLRRNIVQCLEDFDIPLFTSTTVTEIHGSPRLTGVTVSQVDASYTPIPGSQRLVPCDTLLLSVGLIPENALAQAAGIQMDPVTGGAVVTSHFETSIPGVFACGNALHIHDLVDFVSDEGDQAGRNAALHALRGRGSGAWERGTSGREAQDWSGCPDQDSPKRAAQDASIIPTRAGRGVRYVVPQRLVVPEAVGGQVPERADGPVTLRLRTLRAYQRPLLVAQALDQEGRQVARKAKRVMVAVPAQMQSLALDKEFLRAAQEGGAVRIEVEVAQ